MKKDTLLQTISLAGLTMAPPQVCGAIRLVPLLREQVRSDLRLGLREYSEPNAIVDLGHREIYCSFIPHALVLSWNSAGQPVAAFGGQLASAKESYPYGTHYGIHLMLRMAKRERGNQLRFLPMHLAMEGFLDLFFHGPDIAWSEYSKRATRTGLSPRVETSVWGESIAGFADALRVFEIHPHQVGVLFFVADALASAFVTPTPDDYRALHASLLADFYGELIRQYAVLYHTTAPARATIDAAHIHSLHDLYPALEQMRSAWADYHHVMAGNLLGRPVNAERTYTAGPFTLQRFISDLNPAEENHIGEAIIRDTGEVEYLKTYRLTAAQTRRAYLLSQLAAAQWQLAVAAERLGQSQRELVTRLEHAGFGYLLAENVRAAARTQSQKPGDE